MFYDMEGKMHVPMDDGIGANATEQQEENLSVRVIWWKARDVEYYYVLYSISNK
jgi:hypothetical protein